MTDLVPALLGPELIIEPAGDLRAYHALRRRAFVDEQGLFERSDRDDRDDDPRTVVLLAHSARGELLGGVRLGPAVAGPDIGWWQGGRLVVTRGGRGVGPALVKAACAYAEAAGALRFDATVQLRTEPMFRRLGWQPVRAASVAGTPHVLMRRPIGRIARQSAGKEPLGALLAGLGRPGVAPGGAGFVGDDGAPVPGSDLVAACDAILPSMVERDPRWAGWCAVLVNINDLAAMGATPVGLLDAVGARDAAHARRILAGLGEAAAAWGIPILGGHTQLGVPAALSATALGRAARPVPGGGGRPGDRVRLTADLGGRWRPGYPGRQWDSTSDRTSAELRRMQSFVGRARPAAAKDVSMAGLAGTLGMLAEASGCGAVLDVASMPRPAAASMGDWLTCFPGFAMITAGAAADADAGPATTAECGELTAGRGVVLRWPDGELTGAIDAGVTGLGTSQ
jgi:putative N-acetyltransferase (TIGR04045 family)